ncbi:hypothetical protein HAX54_024329 [Datura stramonium]|uniref:Uncharacterized protein n=1 Tax=Datura stramonium TaxID=4076 RepID=A0ABS8S5G8_DATST|nr:hypothetical protein [Datura stramonium]
MGTSVWNFAVSWLNRALGFQSQWAMRLCESLDIKPQYLLNWICNLSLDRDIEYLRISRQNMSFPAQNNRRNNSNSARREWVPRGSTATDTVSAAPVSTVLSPGFAVNGSSSAGDGRDKDNVSVAQEGRVERPIREESPVNGRINPGGEHKRLKDPNLPQLVQEIQEKLSKGNIECMICYDMVRRSAPMWSCSSCYSIFHLNCIKKWARAPTSVDTSAEKNQGFNWRCPGCQSVQLTSSRDIRYLCFCGKSRIPLQICARNPTFMWKPCGKLEKELPGHGLSEEDLCLCLCPTMPSWSLSTLRHLLQLEIAPAEIITTRCSDAEIRSYLRTAVCKVKTCCCGKTSLEEELLFRSNSNLFPRIVVEAYAVGYIAVKRCVIPVIVHHVMFPLTQRCRCGSFSNSGVLQNIRQKMRSSLVIDLVGEELWKASL